MFVVFTVRTKLVVASAEANEMPLVSEIVTPTPAGRPVTLKLTGLATLVEMMARFVNTVVLVELIGTVTRDCPNRNLTVCAQAETEASNSSNNTRVARPPTIRKDVLVLTGFVEWLAAHAVKLRTLETVWGVIVGACFGRCSFGTGFKEGAAGRQFSKRITRCTGTDHLSIYYPRFVGPECLASQ